MEITTLLSNHHKSIYVSLGKAIQHRLQLIVDSLLVFLEGIDSILNVRHICFIPHCVFLQILLILDLGIGYLLLVPALQSCQSLPVLLFVGFLQVVLLH
jgi:hypothetical protein